MRRTLVILVATALLGVLAAYKFPADTNAPQARKISTLPLAAAQTTTSPVSLSPRPIGSQYKDGSFTGALASGTYEDIQVAITVSGGKITNVTTPQANTYGSNRSQSIDEYAMPLLRREVINSQTASIDSISGATYTSQTYLQSLQSAIDQAKA
ncbi:MAG: FMN-binding protein [Candidatus Saccharibacteria bacterium]